MPDLQVTVTLEEFKNIVSGAATQLVRPFNDDWVKKLVGVKYDNLVLQCAKARSGPESGRISMKYPGYMVTPDPKLGRVFGLKLKRL